MNTLSFLFRTLSTLILKIYQQHQLWSLNSQQILHNTFGRLNLIIYQFTTQLKRPSITQHLNVQTSSIRITTRIQQTSFFGNHNFNKIFIQVSSDSIQPEVVFSTKQYFIIYKHIAYQMLEDHQRLAIKTKEKGVKSQRTKIDINGKKIH